VVLLGLKFEGITTAMRISRTPFAVTPLLAIVFAATPSLAQGGVIVQYTAGDSNTETLIFGESFTTPGGAPWDDITFNYYSNDNPVTTPSAAGNAFLLTQEYLGTPSALSSSTPGFLAESTGISGEAWIFNPSVVLNPDTEYWLYPNAAVTGTGTDESQVTGTSTEEAYMATSASADFSATFEPEGLTGEIANFTVDGTALPEPSTFWLSSAALIALAFCVRCKRMAS
jgi:hypothetical protein